MATLYLTEQGSKVTRDHARLRVEREGEVLLDIPAFKVDRVVVFGNVQLSTPAMAYLMEEGVDTAFLTIHGRLRGRLESLHSRNVPIRIRQFERFREPDFRLTIGRAIVQGKLENAIRVLQRFTRNHPGEVDFSSETAALERGIRQTEVAAEVGSLMGIEGAATAAYFQAFAKMMRGDLQFVGRSRRPPRDPPNALLSLGYSMLTNEALGAVVAAGLDPYVGFLHGIDYGRPSLALDLVEEFRHPVVDRLVLTVLNRKVLAAEDFQVREDGGMVLREEALKRFVKEYEQRMLQSFRHARTNEPMTERKLLHTQGQLLARTIEGKAEYLPYLME